MGRDSNNNVSKPAKAPDVALPLLVQQLREQALNGLMAQLPRVLQHCDNTFFDLSSRATSNQEQNAYFESLRELRSKRDEVSQRYRRSFRQCFERLRLSPPDAGAASAVNADGLSLVGFDELEQDVAITTMTSKARAANQEVLYQVIARLRAALPGIVINEGNNPLDPAQLGRSFRDALQCLTIDTKSRLIVLKQFDRDVGGALPGIYQDANRLLTDAGLLPQMTSVAQPQPAPQDRGAGPGDRDERAEAMAQTLVGELALLLGQWRLRGARLPAFIESYSARAAPPLRSEELIRQIARQQLQRGDGDAGDRSIRGTLSGVMASMGGRFSLAGADEDIINLVALFFDRVACDEALSPNLQVILGRLQLPLLKLALRNPEFLGNPGHPARELINDIARLGIGFDDGRISGHDPVLQALTDVAAAIEASTDASRDFFEQLRLQLAATERSEAAKAGRVEARVRETAIGLAKTQAARARVQSELRQRLLGVAVPQAVASFLVDHWQPLLVLTYLRQGEASTDWLEALQVVDDLIWSSQYHGDEKSRARQARMAPVLQEQIRQGLARTTSSQAELEALARSIDSVLEAVHRGALNPLRYVTVPPEQLTHAGTVEAAINWQDMTSQQRQALQAQRVTYAHIRTADRMAVGDWLALKGDPGEPTLRCKLAAKLPATDTYVFVNRLGFKVLEKQRRDVAHDLQFKQAAVIDTSPLFERTMNRLLEALQSGNPQPGA